MMQQLNRKTAQQTGQQQIAAQRSADAASIMGAGIQGAGSIIGAGIGALGSGTATAQASTGLTPANEAYKNTFTNMVTPIKTPVKFFSAGLDSQIARGGNINAV